MLHRTEVLQESITKKGARTYLEIGVNRGACFLRIRARYKIGVDPKFILPGWKRFRYCLKNPWNINNRYYEFTSHEFFEKEAELLKRRPVDVAFVDGLHTYKQSRQDVLNILQYMKQDGVIVMHDCNPQTESAAHPAESFEHAESLNLPRWTGDWSGDVWKTIAFLRCARDDLRVFVLDCDYGLGIVTRGIPEDTLSLKEEEIEEMSYKDLEKDRKRILDLKEPAYFREFVASL